MTTRLAIYTRISQADIETQTATTRQEHACRAFAAQREWHVSAVFEDVDLSAYQPGVVRPAYEAMLEAIRSGRVDGVLVWKLDRLVRRVAEFERFWTVCDEHHTLLASATEPIDTSTDLGLALVRILVALASLESATISLRLKALEAERARRGKPPHGKRPFGLSDGWTDLVPEEAALIREAANRVLAGNSLRQIVLDWQR